MTDTTTQRHQPTDDCEGYLIPLGRDNKRCDECGSPLCPCELAYGHDCE